MKIYKPWASGLFGAIFLSSVTAFSQHTPPANQGPVQPAQDQENAPPEQVSVSLPGSEGIGSFIPPNARLLAYKSLESSSNGFKAAVIVLRQEPPQTDGLRNNPCILKVLQQVEEHWIISASSHAVVDCIYNNQARRAESLNENLKVEAGEFTYVNQQARGYASYTFRYSDEKHNWYLKQVIITDPEFDNDAQTMKVFRESAVYPGLLPWTTLSAFDPDLLVDLLKTSRKPIP